MTTHHKEKFTETSLKNYLMLPTDFVRLFRRFIRLYFCSYYIASNFSRLGRFFSEIVKLLLYKLQSGCVSRSTYEVKENHCVMKETKLVIHLDYYIQIIIEPYVIYNTYIIYYVPFFINTYFYFSGARGLNITHKNYKKQTSFNVKWLTNIVQTIVVYPEGWVGAFLSTLYTVFLNSLVVELRRLLHQP